MAEPLKNYFQSDVIDRVAAEILAVYPDFKSKQFVANANAGFEDLELMPRGKHIAQVLFEHLPNDYSQAIEILLKSLGPAPEVSVDPDPLSKNDTKSKPKSNPSDEDHNPIASFYYMIHTYYVMFYGLEHFDLSMKAQYQLTQRFTCEFSMRPFIERYPSESMNQLREWASDDNAHVRRLVSECTRPRLPWAGRLKEFQRDPSPVIELLELLKNDVSQYVRRSVANNLNDIGKDNPEILFETCKQWLKTPDKNIQWIVNHALRSSIKRGEAGAFNVLGYGDVDQLEVIKFTAAEQVSLGDQLVVELEVQNTGSSSQKLLVDLVVYYVKANGKLAPKVFKLKAFDLAVGASQPLKKVISFKPMTTRKLYSGEHKLSLVVNGQERELGQFQVCLDED